MIIVEIWLFFAIEKKKDEKNLLYLIFWIYLMC